MGTYTFDNYIITGKPNTSFHLHFKTYIDGGEGDLLVEGLFNVYLRSCLQGEIIKQSGKCERCEKGRYSLDTKDLRCETCPSGADCHGGSVMTPQAGFWRIDYNSTVFEECPNQNACLGSPENDEEI